AKPTVLSWDALRPEGSWHSEGQAFPPKARSRCIGWITRYESPEPIQSLGGRRDLRRQAMDVVEPSEKHDGSQSPYPNQGSPSASAPPGTALHLALKLPCS